MPTDSTSQFPWHGALHALGAVTVLNLPQTGQVSSYAGVH